MGREKLRESLEDDVGLDLDFRVREKLVFIFYFQLGLMLFKSIRFSLVQLVSYF